MRISQLALSGAALLAATAHAQDIQVRPGPVRTGASPAPVASQLPPAPVNGSDLCATADALGSVTGPIAYDNTNATVEPTIGQTTFTGGYCNFGCAEYGTGQVAVLTDVWFSWTAPSTGRMRITTCPNQNDTKIGVYAGPTCPTGTSCLSCNDDFHYSGGTTAGLVDSIIYLDVTAGQQLLIQVGQSSFNGTALGFAGTFNIDMNPAHSTTGVFDDNAAEIDFGFGQAVGTGILGINRIGNVGDVTTVTGVNVCWGWAGATGYTAGSPAYVGLWVEGPTVDGNPTDAVLVETVATTVQSPGTDTYVAVPFTTPHTVNGIYFIGYGSQRLAATEFPITGDNTGCDVQPDTAWRTYNLAAANNMINLGGNSTPPTKLEITCQAQGATWTGAYHSAFAIRPIIQVGPPPLGTGFCFGDGTSNACPCGNSGASDRGCANSTAGSVGAKLTAVGVASVTADTVVLTATDITGPGLFYQGSGTSDIVFGDGKLCAAVGIIRLGVVFPTAGAASYPGGLTPNPVNIQGVVPAGGGLRHYQTWYRDAVAFCTASTFNLTNGLSFTWVP